jgi:hypothetical protein
MRERNNFWSKHAGDVAGGPVEVVDQMGALSAIS